jgi:hypothetical protein
MVSHSTPPDSRRQEQLSQEARDVLAHAFAIGMPAHDILPIPMTAVEVLIGPGDLDRIMMGGGFNQHYGSDSLRYFTHADDEQWALVFAHDCDGDPERGRSILARYSLHAESED